MKVKCLQVADTELAVSYRISPFAIGSSNRNLVDIDSVYDVFAILFDEAGVWFLIMGSASLWYPFRLPAPLFEIVDGTPTRGWIYRETPGNKDHAGILAPEFWAVDPLYYDRLTTGEREAVDAFNGWRVGLEGR